jgi:hypothetical protein
MDETSGADPERAIDELRPAIASMDHAQAAEAIVALVTSWAGSEAAARAWFSDAVLPGIGSTPQALIRASAADLLLDHLQHIAAGGYA